MTTHNLRRLAVSCVGVTLAMVAMPATPSVAAPVVPPAPGAPSRPAFSWPLPGPPPTVARRFAPPAERWGTGHRGVDLLAPPGTPVLAAGAGVVAFAAPLAGRGVVTVRHGALRTTYEPVRASVRVGQAVAAGAPLGVLERGLGHCGPRACLHWGLLRGTTYLDPLSLLRRGPARLLPIWRDGPPRAAPISPYAGAGAAAPVLAGGPPRQPTDASAAGRSPPGPARAPAPVGVVGVVGVVAAAGAAGVAFRRVGR